MALSLVSGTHFRFPLGNRFLVVGLADEVDSSGDEVAASTLELSNIDAIVGAVCKESNVAVRAHENSTDGSDTSAGALFLQTASGTHDIWFAVIGR